MTQNISFAERIKKLRSEKGYSQKDIAKIIDVNYINYGRYERGLSRPSADTLQKLADAFGVSVDYILEGTLEDSVVADFEDKELLNMFKAAEKLSAPKKEAMKVFVGALLFQEKTRQDLPASK